MVRSLTDEELACQLEAQQVDRVTLNEAAKRIRNGSLCTLIHTHDIISAVSRSPLIEDDRQEAIVEQIIHAVQPTHQSSSHMSSLASQALHDPDATDREKSLAASVLSQDEIRGQS